MSYGDGLTDVWLLFPIPAPGYCDPRVLSKLDNGIWAFSPTAYQN